MVVWRQWLGASIIAVLGIALGAASLWSAWPRWAFWLIGGLTVVGVALAAPMLRARPDRSGSAFIRGDIAKTSITNTYSDADTFIDGSVRESLLHRIIHRPGSP